MNYFQNYWEHTLKDKNINSITSYIKEQNNNKSFSYDGQKIICDSDIKYPLDNLSNDKELLNKYLISLKQIDIDNIISSWKPEINYLKQFPTIYIRLIAMPNYLLNQYKIVNSPKDFFMIIIVLLNNTMRLIIRKLNL